MTPATANDWHECQVVLPAPHNWLVLDLQRTDQEAWAGKVAGEHVAADACSEVRDAFAADVLWYRDSALRQGALCAALLVPADSAVIASYTVRELKVSREFLSVEALRAEALRSEGPYFGGQRLAQVELPLGPALRVHRQEPTAPDSDGGTIVEGVAHYIVPREHSTVLECRLLWSNLGFGEELLKMAEELAESVRLV
ncbi:hypothetical protein [Streptomyces sp. NPDC002328]|uniref:hypothetical protein n=1 Tax=Streptomyces sp. NPDC002328 TaxID=3364642 RepID=UPI0036CF44A2